MAFFVMPDFMRKHGFQFRLGQLRDKCVEQDDFSKTSEPGEEGVGVTRAFAAIHHLDTAGGKIGPPRQRKEAFAQAPSGSGVNLLKSGMMIAGAISSKSN